MQVMHEVCCGLEVHKKSVTACVQWASGRRRQTREFGTFTKDLLALGDWLRSCGVTHVAMESTGVYWKPVWNLLEGQFEQSPLTLLSPNLNTSPDPELQSAKRAILTTPHSARTVRPPDRLGADRLLH